MFLKARRSIPCWILRTAALGQALNDTLEIRFKEEGDAVSHATLPVDHSMEGGGEDVV